VFKKFGGRKMKSTSLFAVLVLSLTILALASVMVTPAAAADPVIVGKWDRTDGVDVYTIYANHVTETVIEGQTYRGTWEYDGTSGYKYIFYWEHSPPGKAPFVDYVTVAADGQSYSGVNNYGDDFHCVRIGNAPVAESGGFPIVPVAIGGGIAAIAVVGAAVYFLYFAGGTSASAGALGGAAGAETPEGLLPMEPLSSELFENFVSDLVSDTVSDVVNSIGGISTNAATSANSSTSTILPSSSGLSDFQMSEINETINDMISSGVLNACKPNPLPGGPENPGITPGVGAGTQPDVGVSVP
jgi:hypothetical protein